MLIIEYSEYFDTGRIHSGFNDRVEPSADQAQCFKFIKSRVQVL